MYYFTDLCSGAEKDLTLFDSDPGLPPHCLNSCKRQGLGIFKNQVGHSSHSDVLCKSAASVTTFTSLAES